MPEKRNWFGLIKAIIEAFKGRPGTISYPKTPLKLPNNYRGSIEMAPEKCSGCGLCVVDCPAEALVLIKESRNKFQLVHYPARCAYCGQCEDSCHKHAIYHSRSLPKTIVGNPDTNLLLKRQD